MNKCTRAVAFTRVNLLYYYRRALTHLQMYLSTARLVQLLLQLLLAHLRHWQRKLKLFSRDVSISHSWLYWIQVFHWCETNQRVTKLSSSASRVFPRHFSLLNCSKKIGSWKILVLTAYVLPEMHEVPPSIECVAEISKLRRWIYAAPNQL